MKALYPIHWPLRRKFFVAFLVILGIAAVSRIYAAVEALDSLNRQNQLVLVEESGLRRAEAVELTFQLAQERAVSFATDTNNSEVLFQMLTSHRYDMLALPENLPVLARSTLADGLLNRGDLFNAGWLLAPDGSVLVAAARTGQTVPFDPDLLIESALAQQLTRVGQPLQAVFLAQRTEDNPVSVELITALRSTDGTPQGFVVAQINPQRLFLDHLQADDLRNLPYSYVLIPPLDALLTTPQINAENLAALNFDSLGIQRGMDVQSREVLTYATGPADARRTVAGYHQPVQFLNARVSLVTEITLPPPLLIFTQMLGSGGTVSIFISLVTVLVIAQGIGRIVVAPLELIDRALHGVARGDYERPLPSSQRQDEIGQIAGTITEMRSLIQQQIDDMQKRLAKRDRDVQISQDIGRAATAERDLQRLMDMVVNLIVANFDTIYHAQIFLVDDNRHYALLKASTGERGKMLLQRGHRLEVGSVSVIGQVAELGQVTVVRDTVGSEVHRLNEFLPDTRAELAVPLRLGDTIIGALDVQSTQNDSFDEDQIRALQSLADQITIAIANAQLYDQTQQLLTNLQSQQQTRTSAAWREHLNLQRRDALVTQAGRPVQGHFEALRTAATQHRKTIVGDVTGHDTVPFAVPVMMGQQVLGVVEYEVPKATFTQDTIYLAEEMAERLSVSLENARLFQDSQRATDRERIVNDIAARLTSQTDIQTILETAVEEVREALRVPHVGLHLNLRDAEPALSNGNGSAATNGHTATDDDIAGPSTSA